MKVTCVLAPYTERYIYPSDNWLIMKCEKELFLEIAREFLAVNDCDGAIIYIDAKYSGKLKKPTS